MIAPIQLYRILSTTPALFIIKGKVKGGLKTKFIKKPHNIFVTA
jgi:hypothetical protein